MIKTIDTRNITDIMLEAQNVIDGTTTYSDPLSFKDAADIFIAMTEAAPAVEPAQAVEPLDAPHPDYAEYITFEGSTRIVISPDDYEQLYNAATRRAPPAIDAETKRMVLEQTNTKAAEPAQAVPAFWASENILEYSLRDNISCILTTTKCAANTVPLYTAPPAIVEAAQAVPIYQVALEWGVGWIDVSEDLYKKCEGIKRIIYIDHAPLESKQAVPVGRVLHWKGDPGFAPKTCIRGFDEYPKGCAQLGPWEEGENVYTVPPAISEPAQAVPCKCEPVAEVLWYEPMLHEPQTKKGHKIIDASLSWMEKAPLGTKLYAAPPAIDDETRHRLILVCEYLETVGLMFVSPRVISSQIRAILEAGNEN